MIYRPGEDVDKEDTGTNTVEAAGDKGIGYVSVSTVSTAAVENVPSPEIATSDGVAGGDNDDATLMMLFQEGSDKGSSLRSSPLSEILSWGGDIGLLASIVYTLALTDDTVPWSGL